MLTEEDRADAYASDTLFGLLDSIAEPREEQ